MERMKITTLKELDSALCRLDMGKSEASIGDVREVRRKLMGLIAAEIELTGDSNIMVLLMGKKKARRKLAGLILDEI
jgi:hypothetical protein